MTMVPRFEQPTTLQKEKDAQKAIIRHGGPSTPIIVAAFEIPSSGSSQHEGLKHTPFTEQPARSNQINGNQQGQDQQQRRQEDEAESKNHKEEEELYEVERIVKHKPASATCHERTSQYYVKWVGYKECSWVDEDAFNTTDTVSGGEAGSGTDSDSAVGRKRAGQPGELDHLPSLLRHYWRRQQSSKARAKTQPAACSTKQHHKSKQGLVPRKRRKAAAPQSSSSSAAGEYTRIDGHWPESATCAEDAKHYLVQHKTRGMQVLDSAVFAGMAIDVHNEGQPEGSAALDQALCKLFRDYWQSVQQLDDEEEGDRRAEEAPSGGGAAAARRAPRQHHIKYLRTDVESDDDEEDYPRLTVDAIVSHFPGDARCHEHVWLYQVAWEAEGEGGALEPSWEYAWRLEEDFDAAIADVAAAQAAAQDELGGAGGKQQQGLGGTLSPGPAGALQGQLCPAGQDAALFDPYVIFRDYWQQVHVREDQQSHVRRSQAEHVHEHRWLLPPWFAQRPSFQVVPAGDASISSLLPCLRWPLTDMEVRAPHHPLASGKHAVRQAVASAVLEAAAGQPAIAPRFFEVADLVLCNAHPAPHQLSQSIRVYPWKRWRGAYLESHWGFMRLNRSACVVDQATGVVLMVVCLGRDYERLWGSAGADNGLERLASQQPNLLECVSRVHQPMTTRQGKDNRRLFMTGLRWCQYNKHNTGSLVSMYVAKDCEGDECKQLRRLQRLKEEVEAAAVGIYEAERLVAPQLAAARMAVSKVVDPPTSLASKGCPVFCLGVSEGYMSLPHTDDGACNISETVLFHSQRVPAGAGYSFVSLAAQVVVDLKADDAVLVMLPGGTLHGTPYLDDVQLAEQGHKGTGVVIVNKSHLCSEMAAADLNKGFVREKIESFYTSLKQIKPKVQ